MMCRRDALREFFLVPMGWGLSFGMLSFTGCAEETTPFQPLGKSKDEVQKDRDSEQLPGIPRQEPTKKKRRR